MRNFFIQCLKDLESLTGIRQLYFLQSDLEDGERKKNVLIEGMIATSKQFPYISEQIQQKIIRDMMVKDQDYDSLNSRIIYKWLNLNKDLYFTESQKALEIDTKPLTDEESERVDKLLNEVKGQLVGDFKPKYTGLDEEIKKLEAEDKERQEGRKAIAHRSTEYFLLHERKLLAAKSRGLDKLGLHELKEFVIEDKVIVARNKEEAQEIYLEVYI